MPTQSALKVIETFDQCAVQLIARYHLINIATWTHRQADTHIHTRVHMLTHATHTHAHVHAHTCTRTHTHMHTYTHTHVHAHTQTDVNSKT